MNADAVALREALAAVALGTALCEGLERIQRSHADALIVLGYTPEIKTLYSGGFDLDVAFVISCLRELCRMDDAVILDIDRWRIRKANVQPPPDPSIPTNESDIHHRTAQRTVRQTHLPILSLSASMRIISIYIGEYHRLMEEPEALLTRANFAIGTLDRYSRRLDEVLQTLTVLEIRDSVTVHNVTTVLQHMEMTRRTISEINNCLEELGSEGRLLALQADNLIHGSASGRTLVMRGYVRDQSSITTVEQRLSELPGDKLVDLTATANIPDLGILEVANLDREIQSRGIRAPPFIPHLPWSITKDISSRWGSYTKLRAATAEDLQSIEGIGPYRAKLIHENLGRQVQMAANGLVGW